MCSGDLHLAPYLDNVLRKTGRIETRSFRDHEDFAKSGEVGSQPYGEGAREERLLIRDGPCKKRREAVLVDKASVVGMCSMKILLSAAGWQAWIEPHW